MPLPQEMMPLHRGLQDTHPLDRLGIGHVGGGVPLEKGFRRPASPFDASRQPDTVCSKQRYNADVTVSRRSKQSGVVGTVAASISHTASSNNSALAGDRQRRPEPLF